MITSTEGKLQVDLRLPANLFILAPLIAFAREYATGIGFAAIEVQELHLALEEAISNVIRHGYQNDEQASFDLQFMRFPAGITVVIREKGQPFDISKENTYTPPDLEGEDSHGLGLFLLNKLVDKVEYSILGRQGKEMRLTKYMRSRLVAPILPAVSAVAPHSPAKLSPEVTLKVRPFTSADAVEISRCAYAAYGYSYQDFIYYPEKLIEANQSGLLYSAVAVDEGSGRVVGHGALKFKTLGSSVAELAAGIVHPDVRRMGVFGLLEDFLIKHARCLDLDGVFIDAVTNHVASQQLSEKSGFRSCAIMFGLLPSDSEFKEITGLARQKISVLVRYKLLIDYSQVKIYPPVRHSRQIAALYKAIGIDVVMAADSPAGWRQGVDEMSINASHDSVLNVAQIEVMNFGDTRQVLREVHAYLRNFCIKKVDVIFLHLDLSSPPTALLTEEFEKMGFFFSGILPGGKSGRETLILQYLNNLDFDYGEICLSSNDAKELLAYIKQHGTDITGCDY